jgi:long-chain acyl-CoA synthetase
MNICEHVGRGSCDHPERAALLWDGRPISYRELDERSARAASVFASAGVKAGDRVAVFLPNLPAFVIAYLGALKIGAIVVSLNATQKEEEVAFVLADCRASVAVTTRDLRERILPGVVARVYTVDGDWEEALDAANPRAGIRPMQESDPAVIVYTSGTTGRPKGATLSHGNVVRNMEAKHRYLGIRAEDKGLLFMPLYHCFAQNAVLNAFLQAGATVVLHRRFDYDQVIRSITHDKVTMFFGVPTTFILLLDKVSLSEMAGVRYYFSAAAMLPPAIEERWTGRFGALIYQGYGLTETSPFASYNHLTKHRQGSIGTPIDGVEMKIVDVATGGDAAPGEKGEILVRGHNVMLGYWNRPQDTANAIRHGWFHTGDVGSVDNEGYFYIHDRLTDMIVSGGVNVYPAEIENVLSTHPAILEAAVYGIPEPLLGEKVCADVVLKPGAEARDTEIRSFCRSRLSPVKVPSEIRFTAEIPKGPTGKILKRILRDQAAAAQQMTGAKQKNVSKEEVSRWIHDWLRVNLESYKALDLDSRAAFADLGMDSLLSVQLIEDLSDWSGCRLNVSAAWSFPTPEAMGEHLASRNTARLPAVGDDIGGLSDEAAEALLLAELEQLNR